MPDSGVDLATIEDFTVRLGRSLSGTEELDRARAVIADASAFVATGRTFTAPVPRAVVGVVCSVALRVFRNPEELTSETIGNYSWRADGGAGLYLTSSEEQILERSSTSGARGIWTQTLTRDGDEDLVFGYDQYGGDPILLARGATDPDVIA